MSAYRENVLKMGTPEKSACELRNLRYNGILNKYRVLTK